MDLEHRFHRACATLGLPATQERQQGSSSFVSLLSAEDIKAAFHKKALLFHPDKCLHSSNDALGFPTATTTTDPAAHFRAIHGAYKFLLQHHQQQRPMREEESSLSVATRRRKAHVQTRMASLQRQWDDDAAQLRNAIHTRTSSDQQRVERISKKTNGWWGSDSKPTASAATTSAPQQCREEPSSGECRGEGRYEKCSSRAGAGKATTVTVPAATVGISANTTAAAMARRDEQESAAHDRRVSPNNAAPSSPLSLSADRRVAMHVLLLQESKMRSQFALGEDSDWKVIISSV